MKEHNLVSVFVGTAMNARYLEAVLGQENIQCLVKNELREAARSGFGGPNTDDACEIYVEQQDYEKAEKLIYSFLNKKEEEQ